MATASIAGSGGGSSQWQDEYDPATWKLDGTMEDLALLYGVGRELAGGDSWPNWYEGNPFKASRDRMMEGRRAGSD